MDFTFTNTNGLLSTLRTEELLNNLKTIYELDYNIGYIQEEYEIAQPFVEDFRKFLFKYTEPLSQNSRILEIGCGGAILLNELKQIGFTAIGVDPSPTSIRASEKFGFELVPGFFSPEQFSENFDLIYHSDVLEHAFDPKKFILDQRSILKNNGILIISVPNAGESIEYGDISMAMHQHLQYFSDESLTKLMNDSGFEILEIRAADYGGSLYCAAQKRSNLIKEYRFSPVPHGNSLPNFANAIGRFKEALEKAEGEIGFYVPLRAMPYLCSIGADMMNSKFRFFDDTAHWHGKHFDGTRIPIENFNDLQSNPTNTIFIMSLTFQKQIEEKIKDCFGEQIKLVGLRQVLEG
jgi:2-polyprenyl-3-methyl-5-hydroxy-6-metoxy-1,4-benzoquinol methylase